MVRSSPKRIRRLVVARACRRLDRPGWVGQQLLRDRNHGSASGRMQVMACSGSLLLRRVAAGKSVFAGVLHGVPGDLCAACLETPAAGASSAPLAAGGQARARRRGGEARLCGIFILGCRSLRVLYGVRSYSRSAVATQATTPRPSYASEYKAPGHFRRSRRSACRRTGSATGSNGGCWARRCTPSSWRTSGWGSRRRSRCSRRTTCRRRPTPPRRSCGYSSPPSAWPPSRWWCRSRSRCWWCWRS